MKQLFPAIIILISLSLSCKEEYISKLDKVQPILVVNARITDEQGPHSIILSYAMPFNQDYSDPVQNADVEVSDQNDKYYNFKEANPGVYISEEFYADSGNSYTLSIKTADGKTYLSSRQALQAKGKIDSIYGAFTTKVFELDEYGIIHFNNEFGISFLTNMNLSKDISPYYRFSASLLIQYTTNNPSTGILTYCWLTYPVNEFPNVMSQENHSSNAQHNMGFVPANLGYYGVVNQIQEYPPGSYFQGTFTIEKTVHSIQISFKQYHINKDILEYYQAINDQLQAKKRIFEPQAYQFSGNMSCIDNPKEVVLGIFEVASVQMRTLMLDPTLSNLDFYDLPPFEIDKLSETSCGPNPPSFW